MIVSHRYRYIFIKTKKTAGTSIEIALSRHCGPRDIITRLVNADEELRAQRGGRPPQNTEMPWLASRLSRWRGEPEAARKELKNHVPATRVREWVGPRTWNRYFSFCFERNPWDKAVSAFYYRYPQGTRDDLAAFILNGEVENFADIHRYTDTEGKVMVDHIGRYEHLAAELDEIRTRLGLPELELSRAKGQFRGDKRHYREIFTPEERDRIAAVFHREIALLGYEW